MADILYRKPAKIVQTYTVKFLILNKFISYIDKAISFALGIFNFSLILQSLSR